MEREGRGETLKRKLLLIHFVCSWFGDEVNPGPFVLATLGREQTASTETRTAGAGRDKLDSPNSGPLRPQST